MIFPFPFDNEEEIISELVSIPNGDRIREYLSIPSWKCPKCGSTVFGRVLVCPYNRNGNYCKTKRPE